MQANSKAKTAVVVLVSALLFVGLIVLAYLALGKRNAPAIVLPDTTVQQPEQVEAPPEQADSSATLRADNVLDVLATLSQVSSYHQIIKTNTVWEQGSGEKTLEMFYSSGLYRITVTEPKKVRNYLTDGSTLFFWYEGEADVRQLSLGENSLFSLVGIPDYMTELRSSKVLDTAFLAAADGEDERIYVRAQMEDGQERQYWIDLESACLLRADVLEEQQLTYQLQSQLMELVAPTDEVFAGAFLLPDETEPFAH